jgi:hypothetical protein
MREDNQIMGRIIPLSLGANKGDTRVSADNGQCFSWAIIGNQTKFWAGSL